MQMEIRRSKGHEPGSFRCRSSKPWSNLSVEVLLLLIVAVAYSAGQCNDLHATDLEDPSADLSPEQRCRRFINPNWEMHEFYSPMYPNCYPRDTDCVLNITADYGHIIRIDFRDYFDIEESDTCDNDFLEVRDGAHGYSESLGRFCGSNFPPIITSKDRFLWLRFRSDESLEYKGFRAVFEFKKQEREMPHIPPCNFLLGGVAGSVQNLDIPPFRTNISERYNTPLDCTWTITVSEGNRVYLFFETFNLNQPNECEVNFVELFNTKRDLRDRLKKFCGSVADSVTSTGNVMHLRFYAAVEALKGSSFRAYYTAIRERTYIGSGQEKEMQPCYDSEFDCDDSFCIDASLQCNNISNCKHQYDEEGCNEKKKPKFDITKEHIIIILTMGCGLLGGMCFAMCFNCIRKLVRDGRQIHENIRRSREQLEGRPRSMTSIPSTPTTAGPQRPKSLHDDEYVPKTNGRPCLPPGSSEENDDDDDDLEDELDEEEEEETSVEMRDCECQTRDSLSTQRDSIGGHRTPPPPPPPSRRPPGVPSMSPGPVPTPPPPPASHYNRSSHPRDHYMVQSDEDSYTYRAHALIHVPDKPGHGRPPSKGGSGGKTTPDVLVMH